MIPEARALVRGVVDGETNRAALIIGVACLLVILGFKRWRPRVPGVLVAVVAATVAVGVLGLAERYDLSVVGALPKDLPSFEIPSVSVDDLEALLAGALGIALVSFADTSVLSRTFAIRGGYRVDPNQELVALGAANVAGGLFQGFSVSASSSRTPVAEAAGARTQLTGLVGATAIALMLLFFPNLVRNLPDVDLRFAEMKGRVKDRLRRYALYERFGDDHFYPTVGAAVSAYLETTGVEWTDWEDRPAPTHPGRR